MVFPKLRSKSSRKRVRFAAVAVLLVVIAIGVLYNRARGFSSDGSECADHEELLIGYKILAHNLALEKQLQQLHMLRDATLRAPSAELGRIIILIHKTAGARKKELKKLRTLPPAVTADPKESKMGDSIQDIAENAGKMEMIFPKGSFDMRFLFLQTQATRMIAAVAKSIAGLECNQERKEWMKNLASEFEDIREEMVSAVDSCSM